MKINRFNIFVWYWYLYISKTIFNEFYFILRLINNFFFICFIFFLVTQLLYLFLKSRKFIVIPPKIYIFNAFFTTFDLIYRIGIFLFLNFFEIFEFSDLRCCFILFIRIETANRNRITPVHFTKRLYLRFYVLEIRK